MRKTRKELPSEFVLKKHIPLESVFAFTEERTPHLVRPKDKRDYRRAGADHYEPPSPDRGHGAKGPHHGVKTDPERALSVVEGRIGWRTESVRLEKAT